MNLGEHLVERVRVLLARFPMRLTGGPGERGLQEECVRELTALGGQVAWQEFRWGRSIYASLAFHFGLGTFALGLAFLSPLAAAAAHLVIASSYVSESMWKRPILRNLLPSVASQNAIVTFAAKKPVTHRIVTLAHADAAFTGLLFSPGVVRMAAKETKNPIGRAFRKGLALATFGLFALAGIEVGMWLAPHPAWWVAAVLLVLPSFAAFALNVDVVARDHVVPAANDNLSGCVATLELAQRLVSTLPDDIELVTVITGAEEAGTGGAANLLRRVRATNAWPIASTTILALDTFSGGDPRLLQEGELIAKPIPPKLAALTKKVCAADPTLGEVPPYEIPSGATDAWPFLAAGYESLAFTCIDPSLGAPRNYHLPSDTAENLDADAFARTFRFTEQMIAALARERSAR
ncbi:MAG: uncharacterized protein JWP97_4634 [Labilithrix sp.]|nr:uncharacterized protein [Labilithrix sp.]